MNNDTEFEERFAKRRIVLDRRINTWETTYLMRCRENKTEPSLEGFCDYLANGLGR